MVIEKGPSNAPETPAEIAEAQQRFIAAWGQMGSVWGISRTMAEVHALLYITAEALCTDDIMDRIGISRGNASMSLRALLEWGVISRTHKRGDRKEYFEADLDIWSMFRSIVRERMKREIEPLVAQLYEVRALTPDNKPARAKADPNLPASKHNERIDDMLEFFAIVEKLGHRFVSPSGRGLETAAKLLSKVT